MSNVLVDSYKDSYGVHTFGTEVGVVQFKILNVKKDALPTPPEEASQVAVEIIHYALEADTSGLGSVAQLRELVTVKLLEAVKAQVSVTHLLSRIRQDNLKKDEAVRDFLSLGFKINATDKEGLLLVKEL